MDSTEKYELFENEAPQEPMQVQFQPMPAHFQPVQAQMMAYPVVQHQAAPQGSLAATHVQQVQGQPMQQAQVQLQTTTTATTQVSEKWSWCHLVTSVFAFFFCQPFGLIALVMSLLSYSDHKAMDYKRSKGKRNVALGFGIASIMIWSLVFIVFMVGLNVVSYSVSYNNNTGYGRYCYWNYDGMFWNQTDLPICASGAPVNSHSSLLAPIGLLVFVIYHAVM